MYKNDYGRFIQGNISTTQPAIQSEKPSQEYKRFRTMRALNYSQYASQSECKLLVNSFFLFPITREMTAFLTLLPASSAAMSEWWMVGLLPLSILHGLMLAVSDYAHKHPNCPDGLTVQKHNPLPLSSWACAKLYATRPVSMFWLWKHRKWLPYSQPWWLKWE